MMCSRCTSVLSVNASRNPSRMTSRAPSQLSLYPVNRRLSSNIATNVDESKEPDILCKICLLEYPSRDMAKLQLCGCQFCKEVILPKDYFFNGRFELSRLVLSPLTGRLLNELGTPKHLKLLSPCLL